MDPYQSPQIDPLAEVGAGEPPAVEQLQVEHFVLYAGSVALAAWCHRTIYDALAYPSLSLLFGRSGWIEIVRVLLQALGIAALGLLVLRRYQRRPTFPTQFGHWLLLLQGGLWIAANLYAFIEYRILFSRTYNPDGWTQAVNILWLVVTMYVLLYLAVTVIPVLAAIYSKGQPSWQFCAVALALHMFWFVGRPFFGKDEAMISAGGSIFFGGIALVAFCVATIRDLIKPAGKDPLHWLGIACHFGLTIAPKLMQMF